MTNDDTGYTKYKGLQEQISKAFLRMGRDGKIIDVDMTDSLCDIYHGMPKIKELVHGLIEEGKAEKFNKERALVKLSEAYAEVFHLRDHFNQLAEAFEKHLD